MLDTLIKIKIRHELYNLDPYKEIRLKRKWRKKSNKDFISYKNGVIEKNKFMDFTNHNYNVIFILNYKI